MALSNRELAAKARDLAHGLGEEVDTSGLNKSKLMALVAELEERSGASDQGRGPELDPEPGPEPDDIDSEPAPVVGTDDYRGGLPEQAPTPKTLPKRHIGQGKSVMSRRGMLREYDEVKPGDFDEATTALLINKGCIVES